MVEYRSVLEKASHIQLKKQTTKKNNQKNKINILKYQARWWRNSDLGLFGSHIAKQANSAAAFQESDHLIVQSFWTRNKLYKTTTIKTLKTLQLINNKRLKVRRSGILGCVTV